MAVVVSDTQVKLNDGKVVQAQQGGWYDGQQFWGGTLSQPGQINSMSNQQGAGQAVSQEVIRQTNPANVGYINQQRQQAGLSPSPTESLPSMPKSNINPSGSIGPMSTPETINLPKMYEDLYGSSGIRDIEADLNARTVAYNNEVAKIKDNPYLSEATMTGRIAKLDQKFAMDSASLRDQIATKKADIETKLNLQTKQLDINNQQTQMAWDQFNTLLASGALDNASGDTIAQITRSTGIPSDAIISAIGASKDKNNPVSVSTFTADSGEVYAVALDSKGNVVNRTSLGLIGNAQKSGGSGKISKDEEKQQNRESLIQSVKSGITLKSLLGYYGSVLDTDTIVQLYNLYSPFGPAKEDIKDIKAGKFNY